MQPSSFSFIHVSMESAKKYGRFLWVIPPSPLKTVAKNEHLRQNHTSHPCLRATLADSGIYPFRSSPNVTLVLGKDRLGKSRDFRPLFYPLLTHVFKREKREKACFLDPPVRRNDSYPSRIYTIYICTYKVISNSELASKRLARDVRGRWGCELWEPAILSNGNLLRLKVHTCHFFAKR